MRATGEAILLHPMGTFSNVTRDPRGIKGEIFADMSNGDQSGDTAGKQESDQVVVFRRPIRSFRDATPYRNRVRGKIFAAMFKWDSSGGAGGGRTSDPGVFPFPISSFGDATLYCWEIFTYLFKREPMN